MLPYGPPRSGPSWIRFATAGFTRPKRDQNNGWCEHARQEDSPSAGGTTLVGRRVGPHVTGARATSTPRVRISSSPSYRRGSEQSVHLPPDPFKPDPRARTDDESRTTPISATVRLRKPSPGHTSRARIALGRVAGERTLVTGDFMTTGQFAEPDWAEVGDAVSRAPRGLVTGWYVSRGVRCPES